MSAAVPYQAALVPHLVQRQVDGVFTDDGLLGADAGEQVATAPGHAVKLAQGLEGLPAQRGDVIPARFHLVGGNAPQGAIEVDFSPLGIAHNTGPAGRQQYKPGGDTGWRPAGAAAQGLQEGRQLRLQQMRVLLGLRGRCGDGAQLAGRVVLAQATGNGLAEWQRGSCRGCWSRPWPRSWPAARRSPLG